MKGPIRVAFVVHLMQVAGAEILVRETIRRLGDRIRPTIFCLDAVGRIGEELVAEGVDLVCFHRKPGRDWKVSQRVARAIRERDIEVVHAHQYTPFFYSALAKPLRGFRPKVVLTEHGRHYPDRVSPLRRAVNRLVLDRLADSVTACCRFSAQGLSRTDGFAGARIEVIENGIEIERYGPPADKALAKEDVGLEPDRRYLIHVARHHPVKDQATLVRGFAAAVPDLPGVDLLMVGDGPLRAELENLAVDLRVPDRVKFLGIRTDIPELMRAADVFALTSLSEAASLTLLEAMASGLPAIVTEVGGNPEIVRHEHEGLLFPRGDVNGCAGAIRRLFRDPELAANLGAAGRERAADRYQLDRTVEEYYAMYSRLAGRCPS
ncbi:Glycosyl transferase, group 1 family protein OS=Rhodopirellula sp. SWK7 GN=RRSWK_02661 PE=4 SV=1: Glyco_trans_4_4: Glycos_transf_1 [Gemmata massiliana]|uniref:Glycosyltransferase subfamily 4-like N-terminal domain-containing protein n=1 Tax=Gemmata massiliana TaxID=1210884 RepID=A0A6P2DGW5_9BACT|nr:glycosyltransferase [Gemmata massiliana]VTS00253.1 Glycosyl transferase, group 1 family protein OS=Rhodopirellula sp. SWK7 GN=RRSWK_02661 PE=4 SV=1: Glyco_trans_4_4: Glycos_transf_1 [Gemmata massiliana]